MQPLASGQEYTGYWTDRFQEDHFIDGVKFAVYADVPGLFIVEETDHTRETPTMLYMQEIQAKDTLITPLIDLMDRHFRVRYVNWDEEQTNFFILNLEGVLNPKDKQYNIKAIITGDTNVTYEFDELMNAFAITNDLKEEDVTEGMNTSLYFTINTMRIEVKLGEEFDEKFDPFDEVVIEADGVPFRACGKG